MQTKYPAVVDVNLRYEDLPFTHPLYQFYDWASISRELIIASYNACFRGQDLPIIPTTVWPDEGITELDDLFLQSFSFTNNHFEPELNDWVQEKVSLSEGQKAELRKYGLTIIRNVDRKAKVLLAPYLVDHLAFHYCVAHYCVDELHTRRRFHLDVVDYEDRLHEGWFAARRKHEKLLKYFALRYDSDFGSQKSLDEATERIRALANRLPHAKMPLILSHGKEQIIQCLPDIALTKFEKKGLEVMYDDSIIHATETDDEFCRADYVKRSSEAD